MTETTLLAIDNTALPLRGNLCLYLSSPEVRAEPVLTPEIGDPDAPDNAATHFYGGVVREDGIHWVKPELGQVEWRGSPRNNVIRLAHTHIEGVHVIRDDGDPDPGRRYKMVYNYLPQGHDFWCFRTATSADGLHWSDGPDLPYDGSIEQSSLYEFGGCYYISGQMHQRSEGGHATGRQGYALVSPDSDQRSNCTSRALNLDGRRMCRPGKGQPGRGKPLSTAPQSRFPQETGGESA